MKCFDVEPQQRVVSRREFTSKTDNVFVRETFKCASSSSGKYAVFAIRQRDPRIKLAMRKFERKCASRYSGGETGNIKVIGIANNSCLEKIRRLVKEMLLEDLE